MKEQEVNKYEQARKANARLACELCPLSFHYTTYKRHLVKVHGWRYVDGVFPEPVEESND